MTDPVVPEFSRLVVVDAMAADDVVEEIVATAAECAALARRFDLPGIAGLSATIHLSRLQGGRMVRVRGRLAATVCQTCVVTLESFDTAVGEDFAALFVSGDSVPVPAVEVDLDAEQDDEDWPEPMVAGRIDIGELAAQHLSLALDPYPRRPGAVLEGPYATTEPAPTGSALQDALAVLARPH